MGRSVFRVGVVNFVAIAFAINLVLESVYASDGGSGTHSNEVYWAGASNLGFNGVNGPFFSSEEAVTQALSDALVADMVAQGVEPPIPECGVKVGVNLDWTYLGFISPAVNPGHRDEKIIRISWAISIDANTGNCFPFVNNFGSPYSIYRSYDIAEPKYYLEPPDQCMTASDNESNPCNPASGNKSQAEVDYVTPANGGPDFTRYYNSKGTYRSGQGMAAGWRHTYLRTLNEKPDQTQTLLVAVSADQSAAYGTASDACAVGWTDIKDVVWAGDLAVATPEFAGGNVCKIELGGNTVAYFPIRSDSGWSGFSPPNDVISIIRASGSSIKFEYDGSVWVSELNAGYGLVAFGSDWIFTDTNDVRETYNSSGQLTMIAYRDGTSEVLDYNLTVAQGGDDDGATLDRVTGPFGHAITFDYDLGGRLDTVTTPDGVIQYSYDGNDNLIEVAHPDGTTRQYHFEDTELPNHLTGITDENSDRYATWSYDAEGRAISSEHAGGKELVQLAYNGNGSTTLTMANGASRIYTYSVQQGRRKLVMLTGDVCSTCPGGNIADRTYDSNGFLDSVFDWNGNETQTVRNSVGLTETLIEAKGSTDERTTTTSWHSSYRIPTQIVSPKNTTDFTHDANGNVLTATISSGTSSRTWTTTHNASGQPLTIDGPRTDVSDITTLAYYTCATGNECGQLQTVTNALSQTTTYNTYDAAGRPTLITDANGLQVSFTYDWRGNTLTMVQTPTVGTPRTTTMTYDAAGQLATLSTPDGLVLTYVYTAAHYLASVTDNLGNRIDYDYDAMGNLIDEDTYDSGSALKRAMDYAYDLNNRLDTVTSGGFLSDLSIDLVGNLTNEIDPNLASTAHSYDALNRLDQTIDGLTGVMDYNYDAHDNLTSAIAANGATTTYVYDDLDNLTQENSPDRGTTVYTHDEAGNIKTRLDARGKLTSFTYDALNRLILVTLDGGGAIAYEYDIGLNGVGRLDNITDSSGTTTWSYDNFGAVTRKIQTIDAVALSTTYAYDASGRLSTMIYPSGKVVSYGYNTYLPISVSVDGNTILSGATYDPFGPVNGWSWGNGSVASRNFDLRGLSTSIDFAGDTQALSYGNVGQVIAQLDTTLNVNYDYDLLGRLTDFTNNDAGGGSPSGPMFSATPVILANIQTMANESGTPPSGNPTPWMTIAVRNVGATSVQLALGRSEVNTGSISVAETVGYIAIEGGASGSFSANGGTVSYEAQTTTDSVRGWSNGCYTTNFLSSFTSTPTVVATINKLDGGNGGWVRRCSLTSSAIGLTIDEDQFKDSERRHTTEAVGMAAFSQSFDAIFTDGIGTWGMEAASVVLGSTSSDPTFKTVTFRQSYATPPVVVVLATNQGGDPSAIRIRNVTTTGFEASQVEPAGEDGPHIAMTMHYVAAELGTHELPDGTRILVDTASLSNQQHGGGVTGAESWFTESFEAWQGGSGSALPASQAITYDANGNRSSLAEDSVLYSYSHLLNSNRLLSAAGPVAKIYSYDAAGNITGDGVHSYAYDDRGRLVDVDSGSASYVHNGQGQRVSKDNGTVTLFAYDEVGGLVGEYDAVGTSVQETVWFNGAPVAVLEGTNRYYVHTDQLGSPRVITDGNTVIWRWHSAPFGATGADEDPDGDRSSFTYNQRFPGQYYDSETGLHYNYFRTYDPSTGRYLESDPIGLGGGLNTYGYVSGNPVNLSDATGLCPWCIPLAVGAGRAAVSGYRTYRSYRAAQTAATATAAAATAAGINGMLNEGNDNVIPFPDTKADEGEQCDTDDIDPCEELLAALQVRSIQLLGRASQGIDVTFEVRQYQAALREFMLLCPELSNRAPKIPPGLR